MFGGADSHNHSLCVAAGVMCGAAASGQFTWTLTNVAKSIGCMVLAGPLLTGYTQTMNDYFDREIYAINEPNRPIPSGDTLWRATPSGLQYS